MLKEFFIVFGCLAGFCLTVVCAGWLTYLIASVSPFLATCFFMVCFSAVIAFCVVFLE